MKRIIAGLLCTGLVFCLAGCSQEGDGIDSSSTSSKTIEGQLSFTKRDKDASYDEASATKITLADGASSVEGEGASISGDTVTIAAEGTYIVMGSLSNGQISVKLPGEEDKAQIVLDTVSIHNENGPALQVNQADKVFLTLAEGSQNTLSDGAAYTLADGEDEPYATLYSKDDLTINGLGSLEVSGSYRHAIASKDDLVITGGTISVTAAEDAVRGNDAIKIGGGSITVNAGDDAFHSEYLFYIVDGTVNVESCEEGYEAEKVYIHGGNSSILANDDGVNASAADSDSTNDAATGGMNPPDGTQPDMPGEPPADPQDDVKRGDIGSATPQPDRAGKMPDETPGQQEGHMENGRGPNVAGMPNASEGCLIQINGGTLTVNANGDGLDSNGSIEINGGIVFVSGASSSDDTGLDYEIDATVNGGTVIIIGSAGMAEDFTGGSQTHLMEHISDRAGSTIEIMDDSGKVLASYVAPKGFQMVNASAPGAAKIQVS